MLEPVKAFEPLSQEVISMLREGLTRLQCCMLGIDDIDASKGVGCIDAITRCVWTYDGQRITITAAGGTVCFALSKEYDPLADIFARTL